MFKSKALIGTPRGSGNGATQYEFTPIGQENEGGRARNDATTRRNATMNTKNDIRQARNPLNDSPLLNRVHGGSSFLADSSYDTINQSALKPTKGPISSSSSASPFNNQLKNQNLLNNGSNPVIQQQESVSKLQEENYNLKVKIASLTRFLNSITNNQQQEIYQQNSELQEKLIKMRSEIDLLNQEVNHLRNETHETHPQDTSRFTKEIERLNAVVNDLQKSEAQKDQLVQKLREKEKEIQHLKSQEQAKQLASSPVSKTYVQRIEEQLQSLKDEMEDKDYDLRRKEEEIEAREDQIEKLETQLKQSHQHSDLTHARDSQINELKKMLKERDRDIHQYEEAISKKNSQLETLKTNSEKILQKTSEDAHLINELKAALKESNKRVAALKDDLKGTKLRKDLEESDENRVLKQEKSKLEAKIEAMSSEIEEYMNVISEQKQIFAELQNVRKTSHAQAEKISQLEKQQHSLISERDSLRKQLEASDKRYIQLKDNSERTYRAYEQLKKERMTAKVAELDDYSIKDEINILANQVEDLNIQNQRLEKQLEKERQFQNAGRASFEKHELKSLISKCNELQLELTEKENLLQRTTTRLEKELHDYSKLCSQKDDEIQDLRRKLKTLQLSETEKFEDEKFELLKTASSKDKEIKMLQFQLGELKEFHETEVNHLKNTIETLRKSPSNSAFSAHLDGSNELLAKIAEKNRKLKNMNSSLQTLLADVNDYQRVISRLEQGKVALKSENEKLQKKLYILDEKLAQYSKQLKALSNDRDDGEIEELKYQLSLKEKDLASTNRDFNAMKHDMIERYNVVVEEKESLQKKIDKIIAKYRQLQNTKQATSVSAKQLVYLQDQSDYFRMKYTKGTYVISDLKFVNSFMIKSIQATSSHIKKDIKKLQKVGIYPDYDLICDKKPSLIVIFRFVVAAIRIKRKTQYSSVKNKKIEELKGKLDSLEY